MIRIFTGVVTLLQAASSGAFDPSVTDLSRAEPARHEMGRVGTDGVGAVPLKVSEMIKIAVADGWYLDRVTGSHRQFRHTAKPGTTTIAGKLSDTCRRVLR